METEYDIELFRGPERTPFGTRPFLAMVQESLEGLLGCDLSGTKVYVRVLAMPEEMFGKRPDGYIENLIPEFGFASVWVSRGQQLIYEHPHLVSEIVTRTLADKLRREYPDEVSWAFRIDIPGMPRRSTADEAPAVEGGVLVGASETRAKPKFTIRRIPEPDPPIRTLDDFSPFRHTTEAEGPLTAVLSAALYDDVISRPYSHDREDGGFLVGKAYRDGDRPGSYVIEVTGALAAMYTGASLAHFVFTGDSFAEFKRRIRTDRPQDRILGWYHTHLFPATDSFGLSAFDVTLHLGTFTIPWQAAALINVDGDHRVLRFYAREQDDLVPCSFRVRGDE